MQETTNAQPAAISLLELNRRIKALLYNQTVQSVWVMAETSDVQVRRGHCYLELLQKESSTGNTVAKAGAVIWANVFQRVASDFRAVTGQAFASGMKVMVQVSANYHEQYGLKLVINAINPEFTLGDMARRRQEIINRLTSEGIIEMNRALEWPDVPQRVAVISSQGAAGYGDFMNQLQGNAYGVKFYPCLFSAAMQGTSTAPSIIQALNRINAHLDLFDCVVIIRGGGSTTDLNWFDNYELAANIAQFPLPVITGIGHERDVTVLDYVAALRVKTPTAAAEYLIQRGVQALAYLHELSNTITNTVKDSLNRSNEQLAYYSSQIPMLARHLVETSRNRLELYLEKIPLQVKGRIASENALLDRRADAMRNTIAQLMLKEQMRVKSLGEKVSILSPRNTLKRGYSLTMCNGHVVTDATQLKPGDTITSHFKTGHVKSIVNPLTTSQ